MKHQHISGEPYHYCAWPAIAKTAAGTIIVSYCKTEEHVAPTGSIQVVRSTDKGKSWSSPIVARDSIVDDRDCGIMALSDGRLLLTIWSTHHTVESYGTMAEFSYEPHVIEHWLAHVRSAEYAGAHEQRGGWTLLSEDDGMSFRLVGPGPESVHGGIELDSGEILIATHRTSNPDIGLFRAASHDLTWNHVSTFKPPNTGARRFGEPHLAALPNGRVIMMLRSTAIPYNDESPENYLWVCYSDDGGVNWSEPTQTELWGFPPHLLVLSDGRVVCTYGYRRPPYGERACISDDGITWEARREIVLRDDADSGDLGYAASVEVGPGKLLSVYYQPPHSEPPARMRPPDPLRHKPDICGTRWELN